MIIVNGSEGEGGGQILRSALSLSLVTGKAFRIVDIRGKRPRPGLRHQHVTAVRAAQAVSSAAVEGDAVGSRDLSFRPGVVSAGTYAFDIGTAGSTTLVAQTLIPALMLAESPSQLTLEGGTHNPMSPPFEFFARAYLPLLRRTGVDIRAKLARMGFFPAGGGRIELDITPASSLKPLALTERGALLRAQAEAVVARLPLHIAQRELRVLAEAFGWTEASLHAREERDSQGPGNVLTITLTFEQLTEVFTSFGERGVPAETVASNAVRAAKAYLDSGAAIGPHLADQLLVPMTLAGSGRFSTVAPTAHTLTNLRVIEKFVATPLRVREQPPGLWLVEVG